MALSLSAQHVVKRYGGVVALADGNLDVRSGEVVALLGANGSGKSTLSKIITGVVAPNEGQLLLDGEAVHFPSPHEAKKRGITAVYQDLSLIPNMTVAENIWLTHEPMRLFSVNRREMARKTQSLLDLFAGTCKSLSADMAVAALPPDEKQVVEILKALSQNPRLLILDEATASLDSAQVNRLFELVADLKAKGMAIVFVSHRMEEIFRVADRATVLRNGKTVGSTAISETTEEKLVSMMVADVTASKPARIAANLENQPTRLIVENLRTNVLQGVSFSLRDGELLGLGGLQGQGQSDLLLALFGAIPFTGRVTLPNGDAHFRHPSEAMEAGIAFVPGDRATEGLLMIRSILENVQLPSWSKYGLPLRMSNSRQDADKVTSDLHLVMESLEAPVSSLSGGNAQKVVIGKWLLRQPRLLLLNDPTKGIDVGAKAEFYHLLADLQKAGTAILFYSSDDEELLGLCDRVLVLHDGEISAELSGDALNSANLVAASMGT
jgi:ribose transport system ATP-binding protein